MNSNRKFSFFMLVLFASTLLQSCAIYRMRDTGGSSVSLAGSSPSIRTIKVIPKQLPYSLRLEEFTDERPPEEMKRSERAKTAPANTLDFYSYGENYALFKDDLLTLTTEYFNFAGAFKIISSGMVKLPSDLVMTGRVKHYYGYYENATSFGTDLLVGDVGRGIIGAAKEMPTGGTIEIEIQLTSTKSGKVVYQDKIFAKAPAKDTFAPENRDFAAYEYADSRIYQLAINDFLQRLSSANLNVQ
jgi:hypothetical protein